VTTSVAVTYVLYCHVCTIEADLWLDGDCAIVTFLGLWLLVVVDQFVAIALSISVQHPHTLSMVVVHAPTKVEVPFCHCSWCARSGDNIFPFVLLAHCLGSICLVGQILGTVGLGCQFLEALFHLVNFGIKCNESFLVCIGPGPGARCHLPSCRHISDLPSTLADQR